MIQIMTILFLIVLLSLIIYIYFSHVKCEKISVQVIEILSKNVNFLNELYKKKEAIEIGKNIKIYSQFKIIAKVAKCDFISFFKYDYTKQQAILDFIFTLDDKSIVDDTLLYGIGVNILALNSFKFESNDIYYYDIDDMKIENVNIYRSMIYKGTNRVYYQNIYTNSDNPIGLVAISYKDKSYIIPEDDKHEILRMINNLSKIL